MAAIVVIAFVAVIAVILWVFLRPKSDVEEPDMFEDFGEFPGHEPPLVFGKNFEAVDLTVLGGRVFSMQQQSNARGGRPLTNDELVSIAYGTTLMMTLRKLKVYDHMDLSQDKEVANFAKGQIKMVGSAATAALAVLAGTATAASALAAAVAAAVAALAASVWAAGIPERKRKERFEAWWAVSMFVKTVGPPPAGWWAALSRYGRGAPTHLSRAHLIAWRTAATLRNLQRDGMVGAKLPMLSSPAEYRGYMFRAKTGWIAGGSTAFDTRIGTPLGALLDPLLALDKPRTTGLQGDPGLEWADMLFTSSRSTQLEAYETDLIRWLRSIGAQPTITHSPNGKYRSIAPTALVFSLTAEYDIEAASGIAFPPSYVEKNLTVPTNGSWMLT